MSKLNPQKASAYVGPGVLKQGGKTTPVPNGPLIKKKGVFKGSTLKSGGKIKKGQEGVKIGNTTYTITNDKTDPKKKVYVNNPIKDTVSPPKVTSSDRMNSIINNANKNMKKKKAGGMIKRADGSYSKRGLWDNIRANKGSGKKPTKQMLVQEKKIKAKTKK